MRTDLARLDPQAIGLEAQVLERHNARQRAVRAVDAKRRSHLALRPLEGPGEPRFRAEQPADRCRGGEEDDRNEDRSAGKDVAQLQKPYPTEKCSRQSLVSAP